MAILDEKAMNNFKIMIKRHAVITSSKTFGKVCIFEEDS